MTGYEILPFESQHINVEAGTTRQLIFCQALTPHTVCPTVHITIEQQADSVLDVVVIMPHDSIDMSLEIAQVGEHAEVRFYGCGIATEEVEQRLHTRILHNVPNGKSSQLYKCIVADRAQSHFVGELKVLPNAQKTEAYQTNRNILLSDTARMYTKPQLEIYADDVHCSHGATTGQLDESALFYMQQRCIAPQQARMLLLHAFVAEILQPITEEVLHEQIIEQVEKQIQKVL